MNWAPWFAFDVVFSLTGLWVLIFTQCFLQFGYFTTISECMRMDYKYQALVILWGAYLGAEYVYVLLNKPTVKNKLQKDVFPRIYVVGWCGLFGAMVISVRDSEANGYPHDVFTALLAAGLVALEVFALKTKFGNAKRGFRNALFWAWMAELGLLLFMVASGFLTGFDVDRPQFEYTAGSCLILAKGFRYFEFV